jgi:hypothetical protein
VWLLRVRQQQETGAHQLEEAGRDEGVGELREIPVRDGGLVAVGVPLAIQVRRVGREVGVEALQEAVRPGPDTFRAFLALTRSHMHKALISSLAESKDIRSR